MVSFVRHLPFFSDILIRALLADPVLVVPAVFLIGLQGAPLEVVGGAVEKEEIIARANKALELLNKEATPLPQQVH